MLSLKKAVSKRTFMSIRTLVTLVACAGFLWTTGCGGGGDSKDAQSTDLGIATDQGQTLDVGIDTAPTDLGQDSSPINDQGNDTVSTPVDEGGAVTDATADTTQPEDAGQSSVFSTACVTTPDCNLPCASGLCVEGNCNFTPKPGICLVEVGENLVQCVDPGVISEENPCLLCNPEHNGLGWSSALLSTGFEPTDSANLDLTDASFSGVKWHISTRRSYSGTHSLYSGDEDSASYGVSAHVRTEATTHAFSLPEGNPWLGFVMWMETEETLGYDHLVVEVLNPSNLEVLETPLDTDVIHSTTQGRWLPMSVDLSDFAGQDVRIRFVFDTTDAKINSFEGVYLDEIRIWSGCCASDIDCDFSNPCKVGTCETLGAACSVQELENCCLLDTGCDDGNACTLDTCPEFGGGCENTFVEGCCLTDTECDDEDDCTEDSCTEEGGECVYTQLCCESDDDCVSSNPCMVGTCSEQACSFEDVCCHSGSDCNDNDPCTYDICQEDGACAHTFKALTGCCSPEPFNEDLEESEHGFTFENTDGNVGWHWVTGQQSVSGTGALYYGNPANLNYNSGSYSENSGKALSPVMFLTPGVDATLSAKIWMDTESSSYYDKLFIHAQYESEDESWAEVLLWTKAYGFPQETWNTVTIPMHAFAGKSIRIKFTFDTIDGTVNDTEGTYVDDIKLTSTCAGVECSSAIDCDDEISATVEICDNGSCLYVLNDSSAAAQCSTNIDCSDDDFCTIDTCNAGFCEYTESPFCFF